MIGIEPKHGLLFGGAAALLLALLVVLAVDSSRKKSATFDESNHLTRGLYPLSGQGFKLNVDHPPLINLLQALPVWLTMRPAVPRSEELVYPFFAYSEQVLWRSGNRGPAMIRTARLVTVGISVALGLLLLIWARTLYGPWGALLALSAFVFWPEVLAQGSLTTTDMGHAGAFFLFAFALWRLLLAPSWGRTLLVGICLGLALGTKHTTLLLIPGSVMVLIWAQWRPEHGLHGALGTFAVTLSTGNFRRRLLYGLLVWSTALLIALVVIWGVYGFSIGPLADHSWTVPAPDYIGGVLRRTASLKANRWFFLNGEVSRAGFYSFFPLALLVKTPLSLFALLLLTAFYHGAGKLHVRWAMGGTLILLGLYLVAMLLSRMNLGLRYALPFYPFLCLYLGSLVQTMRRRKISSWAPAVLICLLGASTVAAHPDHLSSFNRLIPSHRRHHFLVDSNLDWGQELPALARYQRTHGIAKIRLGYFGTADPAAYGVKYEGLPSFMSRAIKYHGSSSLELRGVIAVSVTLLQGLYTPRPEFYVALRGMEPTASLGGSILIFDFREERLQ